MAKRWQVVEKESALSDWSIPRHPKTLTAFEAEEEALKVAREYITEINVDNALATSQKEAATEVFLMDKTGVYLGDLNGKPWYMQYKKDEYTKDKNGNKVLTFRVGEIVKDRNYFELENKNEVAVRPLPGT